MPTKNKRGLPRADLRVAVKVENQSRLQQFYSKNLSSGGIFLEVAGDPPAIGTKFRVNFEVPSLKKSFSAEAEVVHHYGFEEMDDQFQKVKRYGIGLKFLDLENTDAKLIHEYVTGKALHVTS